MNPKPMNCLNALFAAAFLTILFSLGRTVSLPAKSASSPFLTLSINNADTLSRNDMDTLSAGRLRKMIPAAGASAAQNEDGTWTARTYRESEISLPAGTSGETSESIKSKGRITGGSGISFSSQELTRMAEVIDASNKLMQ